MFRTSKIHQHRCCVMENRILSNNIHSIPKHYILYSCNDSNGFDRLFRLNPNKMYEIKIRYNTKAVNSDDLHWRVVIDGIEHLAREVEIQTPTHTTNARSPRRLPVHEQLFWLNYGGRRRDLRVLRQVVRERVIFRDQLCREARR